ncbi:PP2C family protein-serine/threonine phosphatase [Streptomyces sp. TS71-3]|uniref:PP2C family protein-serine/threonine phosphatase n=1 Tax=Streptomyces sp. TS71-3 TaxID=2733862 RepID=UPI001BB31230|nr:PP2C family protein-serine/threonine phosphatase [Streptomyces sp. TS71-3]
MMALVAAVDLATGPGTGFLPLISLGPAFAGLAGGWRRTAVLGAVALALCCVLGYYDGLLQSRRGFTAIGSVAGVTVAGTLAGVARRRHEAELASVRSVAEAAQRVLLRPVPAAAGHLRASVTYTSATAEARVGGDLYEVVITPHGVRVIVGDVQGKGLEAVGRAAVALGAFREAAHDEKDIVTVGQRVERAMAREPHDEKFVTAVIAELSPAGGALFLNYGHPAPMVVRADGSVEFPEPVRFALPLGLAAHGAEGPAPFTVRFGPGDQILLYTDGVTEARDRHGAFYPLGARAGLLDDADPSAALARLKADLQRHIAGPFRDDAAMLLLRHEPDGSKRDEGFTGS